jgi:hypothetical protein
VRSGAATVRHALTSPGGHVWIAPHGVSVCYAKPGYGACRLQSCTLPTSGTALAAMVAGVPWVDTRDVERVGAIVSAPLIAVDGRVDPEPRGWLDYAPREAVFAILRGLGARTGAHPRTRPPRSRATAISAISRATGATA